MKRSRAERSSRRASVGAALVAGIVGWASPSRADDDGVYGRFDGDVLFGAGAGVALDEGGAMLSLDAGLVYLSTAGARFRYAEAFGRDGALFDRTLAPTLEVRPVFLARYALDLERGPAQLDLALDSLSLSLGPWWTSTDGAFDATPGLELGVGLGVPILPSASGPVLGISGLVHFRDDGADRNARLAEQGSQLVFTLSWHQIVDLGWVDARRAPQER